MAPLERISEEEFAQTWTITVTEETFEQYRILCEEGMSDFCNVGVPGFTPHGLTNLMDYLNDMLAYIHAANSAIRYYERVLERVDQHFKKENRQWNGKD
jgi:hypothetical protein